MLDRPDPLARPLNRRRLLQVGGLGALGLNLAAALRAEAAQGARPGRNPIRSCILVFYYGGPSHHDTWDMKPHAPREVRGDFASIATSVPGLRICEHLPNCARVAHRLAVIRSAHHPMSNHNSAAFQTLCGRTPQKGDLELLADDRDDPPCIGSSVSYAAPARAEIPAFVALPHVMHNVVVLPGQSAGFLGSAHEPLQVARDPNADDFRLSELELPSEVSLDRLDDRQALLHAVDSQLKRADALAAAASSVDAYSDQAFRLLRSAAVRRAFDLAREDPRLRDRYGRTKHGQSMLLARRLVESGVRFVSVYDKDVNGLDNWDTHVNNFGRLKDQLLPPVDQAFAALIEDLADRGLLDSTLVVALGEFGRTPRLNRDAGRDHWPYCYTVVMAGGGVTGGACYGASDKLGAYPDADPVTPGDLAATIFWRFGIDPAAEIRDSSRRPYRLAEGRPLSPLFSNTV